MSNRQLTTDFNLKFRHSGLDCETFIYGTDPTNKRSNIAFVTMRGLGSACTNKFAQFGVAHGQEQGDTRRAAKWFNDFTDQHVTDIEGGLTVEYSPRLALLAPALAELVVPSEVLQEWRTDADVREVNAFMTGQPLDVNAPSLPDSYVHSAVVLSNPTRS